MKRIPHLFTGFVVGSLLTALAFATSFRITTMQDDVKTSPQYY